MAAATHPPPEADKQPPPKLVEEEEDDSDSSSEDEDDDDYFEKKKKKQQKAEDDEDARKSAGKIRANPKVENEDEILWNFPPDPDHWDEWDLGEDWADATIYDKTPGRDPELVEDDMERYNELKKRGQVPPIKPYYVPYRRHYPMVPEGHPDIETPEAVVEELERMEEFLQWASYIFKDGSSYEGTVWNDFAHGKGVYTTPLELCRYEGEWMQNMMAGHGVIEVHLPKPRYPPGSELDKKERAKGVVYSSDFMSDYDKEWLQMDIEDTLANPDAFGGVPFEDDPLWIKHFGEKPEKGRYRYTGQWKHSRMHGCGVYEVNGRQIYGKFYFGELMPELEECTFEQCTLHASLAEVAAAKARMFVNKPDGMVREMKGPFNDPQHHYMYEEEDLWMAPGFINAYYEVPDFWKGYVKEVDEEQEIWLNSFIKSPLRIPMPPELEYIWSKNDEFVLLANDPSSALWSDPENVKMSKEDMEGEVLLHLPTGRIINWANDKDGNLRLFWQPVLDDGSVKPEKAVPLPLGFDEFLGDVEETKKDSSKKLDIIDILKRSWEDSTRQVNEQKKQFDEERARKWQEEDAEREAEMNLRREEAKLMEQIEEEEFTAEIRAIEEHEERLKKGDLDKKVKENDRAVREQVTPSTEGADQLSGDAKSAVDKKGPDSRDDDDGYGDEGENEDEEGEDENDDEPQSFGKVAFLEQKPMHARSNQDVESTDRSHPFSPTIFAALSLSSWFNPPAFLAKHTASKGSGVDLNASATSLTSAAVSIKKVQFRNNHRFHTLRAVVPGGGLTSNIPNNHFTALSAKSVVPIRQGRLLILSKGRHINSQGRSKQNKRGNLSPRMSLSHAQDVWAFPGIDILSMAIPTNM